MILRRFFTLAALAVAVSLSLGDRAQAGYTFSTSITSVTGMTQVGSEGFGSAVTLSGVSGTVNATYGYTTYTDAVGSTIYLVNNFGTNNAGGQSTVNENVYIASPVASGDSSAFGFTTSILVTNQSGGTGTFLEVASYSMGGSGAIGTNPPPTPTLTPPTTLVINGTSFTIFSPLATSVNYGSNPTGGISAQLTSVPEPASVVMLGGGLAGVIALGLRRRSRAG